MKKRFLAVLLIAMMVLSMAACAKKEEAKEEPAAEETTEEAAEEPAEEEAEEAAEEPAATGALKMGVGHAIEASAKEATDDADGQFEGDAYVVGLLVGEDGKAVDCFIDIAQCRMDVSAEGEVIEPEKEFKTKRELGPDYGMQKASSLAEGEWFQQADALEAWVIGKTKEEVQAMAVDADGYPTDADLVAGCTMGHMPVFIEAISNAFDNTVDAPEAVSVGVGVKTSATNSKSETEEEEGQVQFYSYYGYSAVDAAGKIVACVIDSAQITGAISEGKVVAPEAVKTKNELKEEYGMQKASSLEKGEWYQQAEHLASYLVGKDKDEISGLEFDADGKATDPDLLAGCTMGHLTDIVAAVAAGIQ